jgi:hypothetical protein
MQKAPTITDIIDEMCKKLDNVVIKVKTDKFSSKKIIFYGDTEPDILSEIKETLNNLTKEN